MLKYIFIYAPVCRLRSRNCQIDLQHSAHVVNLNSEKSVYFFGGEGNLETIFMTVE